MLNTSNHLYKYISTLIVEYFEKHNIQPGERYSFYLEEEKNAQELYKAFEEVEKPRSIFKYIHDSGSEKYETLELQFNTTRVLIASSHSASEDFFTTLRNEVSSQNGIFEGTAILIIFSEKLDSLLGGSGDLAKEGMPLHYVEFRKSIEIKIDNTNGLMPHEKEILKFALQERTDNVIEDNNSIFDYEGVINCIEKEKIEGKDYSSLGLFPHEELQTKVKDIQKYLVENSKVFEKFEKIFAYGSPENDLEREVTETGKRKLLDRENDWRQLDFSEITKMRDLKNQDSPPEFIGVENESPLLIRDWCKPKSRSITGNRTQNIILFNPQNEFPVEVGFRFNKTIRKEGLKKTKNTNVSVRSSGYKIIATFNGIDNENLFTAIKYIDPNTNKKYNLNILQLPFNSNILSAFEFSYSLEIKNNKQALIIEETDSIIFNKGNGDIEEFKLLPDKNYNIEKDNELKLNYDIDNAGDEEINFSIEHSGVRLPITLKVDIIPPVITTGLNVWKNKREYQTDFRLLRDKDVVKLLFRNTEYSIKGDFRNNILLEEQIISSVEYSWIEDKLGEINGVQLELSNELKLHFDNLRNYFKSREGRLPSLCFLDDRGVKLAEEYINCFINEIELIEHNKPLNENQKNLTLIGVVIEKDEKKQIKYSPLHPINVAYQLMINKKLGSEKLYQSILERLNPMNLVPLLKGKHNITYSPVESNHSPEWMIYSGYINTEQTRPKSFVKKLVTSKLYEFTLNFKYLFEISNSAPLLINIVNLGDGKEVIQGIFEYYKSFLNKNNKKKLLDLIPIHINIYGSDSLVSKFEEITFFDRVEEVEDILNLKLRTNNFDEEDLLNTFFEKVNYYKKSRGDSADYEYAHLTFYQFDNNKSNTSYNDVEVVKTGLAMNGLVSDIPSTSFPDSYRTGFGMKFSPRKENVLTKLSSLYNSLVMVANNSDPFEKGKALCTTIDKKIKDQLESLYSSSQWVTFIEPQVGLDFFKEKEDLVIIHYSDQYNNTSGYDAITVTRKTKQYEFIVKEFLDSHKVAFDEEKDTIKVINFFNAINGDWLLKLIRQDSLFPREKISLLSGIKSALTFLNHPEIIWVPVSLEEVLRVSGSAGLGMKDGLFTVKNLGKSGKHSDDLLMIGIQKIGGRLKLYLYPIELKIGGANLIKKGVVQADTTANLLREYLLEKDGFLREFHRNFFAKLALANAEKMKLYNVWDKQNWDKVINDYRSDLLNTNFDISTSLDHFIGKYGLVYFGADIINRKYYIEKEGMFLQLLYEDGYNFLVKSVDDLIDLFHHKQTTIDKNMLLANLYKVELDKADSYNNSVLNESDGIYVTSEVASMAVEERRTKDNDGMKIIFGTDLNKSKDVIWEPNNTDKVMHTNTGIIGTMGTGKTQFTKSLVYQLLKNSNKNLGDGDFGILIFDYKGDYVKEDFVKATGAKIYEPFHLPYNPLALDATERSKPMLPLHTANDIKETISNAFNLGNVQKQRLRDVIIQAYEDKGIYKAKRNTWNNTPPTIGDVCELYMANENVAQDSLYSAISNLYEFEVFEPDAIKTKSLYSFVDGCTVINLSGYDESIQNLIVAITLDAFYTQMQKNGHSTIEGAKREIRKMILVDEADNFLSKNFNSIKKILKEGREFGVGTILSTQFLNHFSTRENEYSNYILTWVIHRVNEIKSKEVDSLFSLDSREKIESMVQDIKQLDKHHSVVNLAGSGPFFIEDKAFWELMEDEK